MPTEHGAWAFLAEPLLLGLIVAPSLAGVLIVLAALTAFVARQPLRLFVSDMRRGQRYPRTALAQRLFVWLAILGALALTGAVILSRGPAFIVLALAAPFAAVALAFDVRLRARHVAAELCAALALAATATAMAFARGWDVWPAMALWGVLAARAAPTVLYVRARLRLERGEPAGIAVALAAHAAALAWAAWLASEGLIPWLGVAAIGLLAARAAYGLSPRRPRLTTPQLGVSELVFGLITVLAVGLGVVLRD
jgi:hypothetical protein